MYTLRTVPLTIAYCFTAAQQATIALGAPLAETKHRIDELHLRVLLICAGVIIGTVVVGWLISLIMVNPFRLLAQQARAISAQSNPDEVQVRGVRKADLDIDSLTGEVNVTDVMRGEARIGNLLATAQTRGSTLAVQVTGSVRKSEFRGTGEWRLEGDYPGGGTLQFTPIEFEALNETR